MMQQQWFVLVGVGFLLVTAGSMFVYLGNELRTAPPPQTALAPPLEPEAERLLRRLYEIQTRLDLHKLIVARDGSVSQDANPPRPTEINLIEVLLGGEKDAPQSQVALEKLILSVPLTYLRNIPEMRIGSPYVLAVTPEGRAYLASKARGSA